MIVWEKLKYSYLINIKQVSTTKLNQEESSKFKYIIVDKTNIL